MICLFIWEVKEGRKVAKNEQDTFKHLCIFESGIDPINQPISQSSRILLFHGHPSTISSHISIDEHDQIKL